MFEKRLHACRKIAHFPLLWYFKKLSFYQKSLFNRNYKNGNSNQKSRHGEKQ